jgi:protein-S-isoprenylcysteine O-methyltransferase Ste14
MWPPGLEELAKHVPSMNRLSGKLGWLLFMVFGLFFSSFIVSKLDQINPWWCYYTQAALVLGAFLLVDVLGHWCRPHLQNIFGDRAYNVAFRYLFLPGLYLGFGPSYLHIATVPGVRVLSNLPITIISNVFLIIGLLLFLQVHFKLGVARQYYMYQYYPDEGAMTQEDIYNYVRHPLYAGLIYMLIGLVLASGTVQGFFMGLIILPYFPGRIIPEEKDLVRRLGQEYLDYRKRVPAIIPRLNAWPGFFKCLIDMKRRNP